MVKADGIITKGQVTATLASKKKMEKKKRPNPGRRNCLTTLLMWLNIEQATPSGDAAYKSATFLVEPPMRVRHLGVTI